MASLYTNLTGDDLDAFNEFLRTEGLKPSAGLLRIFREWRRLISGAVSVYRYSTLSPEQLSLILGEAAELKRALKRCELALLEPRPMNHEDLLAWKIQQETVQNTLQRFSAWQDGLIRNQAVHAVPPVDPVIARKLALFTYKWTGGLTEKYRDLIFEFLRLFIKIPPPPTYEGQSPITNAASPEPASTKDKS